MIKLIKLELQKNKFIGSLIAAVLGTIFFTQTNISEYREELSLSSTLSGYHDNWYDFVSESYFSSVLLFGILSSVVYTQVIIKEYQKNRVTNHFCYPIPRGRMLLAKLSLVVSFTVVIGFISNFVCFTWFAISVQGEGHLGIDALNLPQDLYVTLFYSLIGSVTAAIIGVLAMSVGFVLKSIPGTIVAGVILSPIFISGTRGLEQGAQMFLGGGLLLCLIVSYLLVKRVNRIEVW